jgi:alpha-tubulin suppressor-like RCC1 family protein
MFDPPRRRVVRSALQRGQGMLEYALILALIALVVFALLQVVGKLTKSAFCQVASGLNHNSGGCTVLAWGAGDKGQLGNGANSNSATPVQPTISGFTEISTTHGYHNLAIKSDGTLWTWGSDWFGELGINSDGPLSANSNTPVQVQFPPSTNIVAASGGYFDSMALDSTGKVWVWGNGGEYQLGAAHYCPPAYSTVGPLAWCTGSKVPVQFAIPGSSPVTAIGAGYYADYALAQDGSLYAWGDNDNGQLGRGSSCGSSYCGDPNAQPVLFPAGVHIKAIKPGGYFATALADNGAVYVWGAAAYGQLGNGVYPPVSGSTTPVQANFPAGVIATDIGAGDASALALGSDGLVYTWGDDSHGELGDNSQCATGGAPGCADGARSATPTALAGFSGVTQVDAGRGHDLALKSDRTVWGWGQNDVGQVAPGPATSPQLTPFQIPGLDHVVYIAAGYVHSLALEGK